MAIILLVVGLVVVLGGGGGYYGLSRCSGRGASGIAGTVLIVLIAVLLLGGTQFYHY
jgi:hypothetical protein